MICEKSKSNYYSLASVVSALAVVFLHVNSCYWDFSATEFYWKTSIIIRAVFYFAVPVFFMMTGATLLDFNERYSIKEFFIKRIYKTLIPFIAWSFIGVLFRLIYIKNLNISDINISFIINCLIGGKGAVDVLWYFPTLFSVYLVIPVFAAIPKERKISIFKYIITISFILNCLMPFLNNLFKLNIANPVPIVIGIQYLLYIFLGYVISNTNQSKKQRIIIYIFALFSLILHIYGPYQASMNANKLIRVYDEYNGLPTVLYSVGIFVLFKYFGSYLMKNNYIEKFINVCSRYTFGVFFDSYVYHFNNSERFYMG